MTSTSTPQHSSLLPKTLKKKGTPPSPQATRLKHQSYTCEPQLSTAYRASQSLELQNRKKPGHVIKPSTSKAQSTSFCHPKFRKVSRYQHITHPQTSRKPHNRNPCPSYPRHHRRRKIRPHIRPPTSLRLRYAPCPLYNPDLWS